MVLFVDLMYFKINGVVVFYYLVLLGYLVIYLNVIVVNIYYLVILLLC